jgi:hypothetical protein
MTAVITAVCAAAGAVASLLLYLFKTRWSQAAQWRKRLGELEDAFHKAEIAHLDSLLGNDDAAVARARAEWLRISEELARHRRAVQSAGISG